MTVANTLLAARGSRLGRGVGLSAPLQDWYVFISHKVLIKSFGKSEFPHKYVNLFLIITNTKDRMTDLCGNRLVQN